jgi:hypothetical protein
MTEPCNRLLNASHTWRRSSVRYARARLASRQAAREGFSHSAGNAGQRIGIGRGMRHKEQDTKVLAGGVARLLKLNIALEDELARVLEPEKAAQISK